MSSAPGVPMHAGKSSDHLELVTLAAAGDAQAQRALVEQEIADLTQSPPNTVKDRLHYARRQMKRMIRRDLTFVLGKDGAPDQRQRRRSQT